MQSSEQLSALDTEEDARRPSLERREGFSKEDIESDELERIHTLGSDGVTPMLDSRQGKRRRTLTSFNRPLHPLPNIETLITYPSLTRPTHNSIANEDPPAQVYSTVIHTPKPAGLRPRPPLTISALDQLLARAEELRASGRTVKHSRLRHQLWDNETLVDQEASSNTTPALQDPALQLDLLSSPQPPSPTESTSSTAMATIASSPPSSPPSSPFPSTATTPVFAPQDLSPSPPPPSPTPSFRSSHSNLSSIYDSYSSSSSSSSPTLASSSSYSTPSPSPSQPASPHRRPSPADDWQFYPSPHTSPSLSARTPPSRPKFSSPEFAPLSAGASPSASAAAAAAAAAANGVQPTQLHASTLAPLPPFDALPTMLFEDEGKEEMEWSMSGGGVVFGAAGLAVGPRLLGRRCEDCEGCEGRGLGLYVIDEIGEE